MIENLKRRHLYYNNSNCYIWWMKISNFFISLLDRLCWALKKAEIYSSQIVNEFEMINWEKENFVADWGSECRCLVLPRLLLVSSEPGLKIVCFSEIWETHDPKNLSELSVKNTNRRKTKMEIQDFKK